MRALWRNLRNIGHVRKHARYDDGLIHMPLAGAKHALPREFRVLVWNVFKGQFGETFDVKLTELAKRSEVMCLQEVLFDEQPQLPSALDHWAYDYSPSYSRQSREHEGVVTLSSCNLLPTGECRHSLGYEPLVSTPKSCVLSQLPIEGGGNLSVLNMHMLLFRRDRAAVAELESAIELLESRAEPDAPALFVGDLNTVLPRQQRTIDGALAEHSFRLLTPAVDRRRFRKLDHIYVRNIPSAEVEVLTQLKASDHPALHCKIKLP